MRIWRRSSGHRLRRKAAAFGALAGFAVLSIGLAAVEASAQEAPSAESAPTEAADPTGARKVVEETLRSVLAVLDQRDVSSDQRRRQIEQIAYQRFDFVTMSKLVVARPWRKFSKEQKKSFISEFRQHLSRSYGKRIDRYQQTDLEVAGHVMEPRGDVTVRTVIATGEFEGTEVDYRMRYRDGRWRAIDVVIEGVSLVSNFRSQFQSILSQGGPEELLRRLAEKNAELAAEDAAGVESR